MTELRVREVKRYTNEEWRAEFYRRAGGRKDANGNPNVEGFKRVRFVCPACKTEYSLGEWLAANKDASPHDVGTMAQEGPTKCIHRVAQDGECNWCAFGLFHGPVQVEGIGGGIVHCFEFAEDD